MAKTYRYCVQVRWQNTMNSDSYLRSETNDLDFDAAMYIAKTMAINCGERDEVVEIIQEEVRYANITSIY